MENILYIINVEAAIYKENKWLIIKRSEMEEHAPGLLAMVGGKVEGGLSQNNILEATLRREIMEEVGIEVDEEISYLESSTFTTEKGQQVVDVVFLCKYKSGEPVCASADEVSEVHWMTCSEILKDENAPIWLKNSIEKANRAISKIN